MRLFAEPRRRWFAYGALAMVACAAVLAAGLVLSGAYNVAASATHFYITDRLLKLALWRSVDTHSAGIEVPPLDDPGLVHLGARHFVTGCQPCHAGPGLLQNPVAGGMYPAAPPLGDNVGGWEDKELFWIVRHGLKYTGMPQWPGEGRDDEVWPVIAFLRELPDMAPERYAELTGTEAGAAFAFAADEMATKESCSGCHGGGEGAPAAMLAPSLGGQNEAYLLRALEEYAAGERESGMMESIAAALSPEDRRRLASEFAQEPSPAASIADADEDLLAFGETVATDGIPAQNVPACMSCHSGRRSPQFPRLEGLSAGYIANQLRLFRSDVRAVSPHAAIMAPIAQRLTEEQSAAVAAYFASRARDEREVAAGEATGR